jgi:hypothetical protein
MSQVALVDTGYWFALLDPRDGLHGQAQPKAAYIESMLIVVPWPVLYETLDTRLVKNRAGMFRFERIVKPPRARRVDDTPYRDDALRQTLLQGRGGRRFISLCDMVIRLMLGDASLRIDALLTFNWKDFADVCRSRQVEIL